MVTNICRIESGDGNPHVASCAFPSESESMCIVGNAVRVAGIVASFTTRSQCEDVSGTQVSSVCASIEASDAGDVVTPYKVSVFQKICWQALNVLIPSHSFSACFISSHLLAERSIRSRAQQLHLQITQHEVYRNYSLGTWCLSHRLCRQ